MDRALLIESIKYHEGYRLQPYTDHLGLWTVGYGHLIHHETTVDGEKIGDILNEMSDPAQHEKWLQQDIDQAVRDAKQYFTGFSELNPIRQNVLVEMCFQMGLPRVKGFVKLLRALHHGQYVDAALEMLDSKWARQTPRRAETLSLEMRSGRAYTRT